MRDLHRLRAEYPDHPETLAWVEGILSLYTQASGVRPPWEKGHTPQAIRAREDRARRYEAFTLLLCPAATAERLPYAKLARRLRKHLAELFTFVRDPLVPATNNAAEPSLRDLVVTRKVSGGTRSPSGSQVRMTLSSICATARLQGKEPTLVFQHIVLAAPGTPSPLAASPSSLDGTSAHSHTL